MGLWALAARLWLLARVPVNYSFDGYERWAGRDHLIVQAWPPGAQVLVWLGARLADDPLPARLLHALAGAAAAAAAAALVRSLGGSALWAVPLAVFPPFLAWSAAPYPEAPFLALLLGALALAVAAPRRAWLADLLVGAAGLVRYEAWPAALAWIAWRRDPRALAALWGPALWVALRLGVHLEGARPSPVDFADWQGLADRFEFARWLRSARELARHALRTGFVVVLPLGVVGAWRARRRGPAVVLLAWATAQLAAVAGWMAGLETAINRMLLSAGVFLGIPAAAALSRLPVRPAVRRALAIGLAALWTVQGTAIARRSVDGVRWEVELARAIEECRPACFPLVVPRKGLGTRDRHDGCQVLQGIGPLRHGVDFFCWLWPGAPARPVTERIEWRGGTYVREPVAAGR